MRYARVYLEGWMTTSLLASLVVFACTFGGAMTGMLLSRRLPPHHLSPESKDVVKLGMGLVATMTALVLGLLVSAAKSSYDSQNNEMTELAAKVVILDRTLKHYGPDAEPIRKTLRGVVEVAIERIFPKDGSHEDQISAPQAGADAVLEQIQALQPEDDAQHTYKSLAVNMTVGLGQERWLMYTQGTTAVSKPMLYIVVFWLTMSFISFGVYAPPNGTVTAALFMSAFAVSSAIFLILEMYAPYGGLIHISSAPVRAALAHMGQ